MGTISLFIILANFLFSFRGFKDPSFFARYEFEVEKILIYRDYKRLVTSGFLHVNWLHLIFNMVSLLMFASTLEVVLGVGPFLLVYFASLVVGNLFTLFVHRNHGSYSSVGASGAVCGLIFAGIALFPGMSINLFFLPSIPSWLYGLLFVGFSIYGIRSRRDNVGHEAHLAGALAGMLLAIALQPSVLRYNYLPILATALPAALFIYLIMTRPHLIMVDNLFYKKEHRNYTLDQRYNARKRDEQQTIDAILEKIHRRGMKSLTKREKEILSEYSKTVR